MRHRAISLALLFSSLMLAAQTGGGASQSALAIRGNATGNGCPIGLRATQGVWDHTIKLRHGPEGQSVQPFGQRVFLSLVDQNPAAIVAATVKVRGLTGKNHIVQTGPAGNESADGVKIMKITFIQKQEGVFSDLYVPGFTSVSSIELLEISYADGKIWKIGGAGVCSVTPDLLMLIANH